jgi:DNA-directed RNA polymerase specialized sigma24 family protein
MLAEIGYVYEKLSNEDKTVLIMRFQLGYEYPEIVKKLELNTEDAARQRVRRAVKRIINKLGGYKPQIEDDFPSEEELESPEEEVTAELE